MYDVIANEVTEEKAENPAASEEALAGLSRRLMCAEASQSAGCRNREKYRGIPERIVTIRQTTWGFPPDINIVVQTGKSKGKASRTKL